jgi:hypothetical protein
MISSSTSTRERRNQESQILQLRGEMAGFTILSRRLRLHSPHGIGGAAACYDEFRKGGAEILAVSMNTALDCPCTAPSSLIPRRIESQGVHDENIGRIKQPDRIWQARVGRIRDCLA